MQRISASTWLLALAAALVPAAAAATAAVPPGQSRQIDIALSAFDGISGRLVTPDGAAIGGETVEFLLDGEVVASAVSDLGGGFEVRHLRPAAYLVRSAGNTRLCRIWARGTAPPAAADRLLMVGHSQRVRGQVAGSIWRYYLPAGLVVGGVIAYRLSQSTGF